MLRVSLVAEGWKGPLREDHQAHSQMLFQTEGKGNFVYFINLCAIGRTILTYCKDFIFNIYFKN